MFHRFHAPSQRTTWAALTVACLTAFANPAEAGRKGEPPVITGTPLTSTMVDTLYAFQPVASDPDSDQLSFRISGKPSWANFNSATGLLSGRPTSAGTYSGITIRVTDGRSAATLPTFSISVIANSTVAKNTPPIISGTAPASVVAGSSYFFQPNGYDADGDSLTYNVTNKPTWAQFDTATGTLSGVPTAADVGTFSNISVGVSDGVATSSTNPFVVEVTAPVARNTPPIISGTAPASVLAGSSYFFQPLGYDADGDSLTYRVTNKPTWAQFDTATGALTGVPSVADVGTSSNISIGVSDGIATSTTNPFVIAVTAPVTNRAPTISGTPVTAAQVDRPYAFGPTASDADGDSLTFTIQGRPSWATFDSSTGTLYGTPGPTSPGTYSNVIISVNDGQATATLTAFAITVAAAPTKNVTLRWTPPTTYTDGSPLTDLAGFTVFYGTASRQYSTSIRLSDATMNTVVLEGLQSGTWYFSVKASNAAGVESDFAAEAIAVL